VVAVEARVMALVKLTPRDRQWLRRVAQRRRTVRAIREARRARAVLDLACGKKPGLVAAHHRVARSTLYAWVARWNDTSTPRRDRLRDAEGLGRGRRPVLQNAATRVLVGLIPSAPSTFGYRQAAWTVQLILAHLKRRRGMVVSESTVRRVLRSLGYRWKWPCWRREAER
jgi:transposase